MSLPTGIPTTLVTGTYTDWQGEPCVGSVTFTPQCTCLVVDSETGAILAGSVRVPLDGNGHFAVELPAAGQGRLVPDDFCWTVTEETSCLGCARSYTISTACEEPVGYEQVLFEDDFSAGLGQWETVRGTVAAVEEPDAENGWALQAETDSRIRGRDNIRYREGVLYKFVVRMRTKVQPTAPPQTLAGFFGIGADGTSYVNTQGAASDGNQHLVALWNHDVDESAEFSTWTGYLMDRADKGANYECPDPEAPGPLQRQAVYVRPWLLLLNHCTDGVQQVDSVRISRIQTGCSLDLSDVLNTD